VAHNVTVIVILGGLDEIEVKSLAHVSGQSHRQIRGWERRRGDAHIVAQPMRCRKTSLRDFQKLNLPRVNQSGAEQLALLRGLKSASSKVIDGAICYAADKSADSESD
jgi:hypothetical protein